jgi:hypothetical protein
VGLYVEEEEAAHVLDSGRTVPYYRSILQKT